MKDKENKTKQHFNYQLFYRRTALIIYDILSVTASSFLAILLRYDMHLDEIPDQFLMPIRNFLPLNILLTMGIFYLFACITACGPLPGKMKCRAWSWPASFPPWFPAWG